MEISQHFGKGCRNALASEANPFRWIIYMLKIIHYDVSCFFHSRGGTILCNLLFRDYAVVSHPISLSFIYHQAKTKASVLGQKTILQEVQDFPKLCILSKNPAKVTDASGLIQNPVP